MQKKFMISLIYCFLFCLISFNLSFGEEKSTEANWKKLSKKERAKIHHVLELYGDDIEKAFNSPDTLIVEPLLSQVDKANGVKINRKSMMKTKLCISHLLQKSSHLSKVSTGNKVVKAKIEIESDSRKVSMYTRWENRNLDYTTLTFTLFYDNDNVKPTEFICEGHGYY